MSNFVVDTIISVESGAVGIATFDNVIVFTQDTSSNILAGEGNIYEDLTSVANDFNSNSNTYKAVEKLFSGVPRVDKVIVYRRETEVAQVKTITKTGSFVAGNVINYNLNGISGSVNFNTDDTTTYNNLATALATHTDFVANATVSGNDLVITGSLGTDLQIDISVLGGSSQPTFATNTTAAGWNIKDDILKASETYDFYWIGETSHTKATVLTMFNTAQSLNKIAFSSSNESNIVNNNNTDLFSLAKSLNLTRAFALYHSSPSSMPEFAWIGNVIKLGNGKVTFAFKRLPGVQSNKLTTSARTNITTKRGNFYTPNGGVDITYPGVNFGNTPIEMIWDIDFMRARLTEGIYSLFVANPKIPYNDAGIQLIADRISLVLNQMIAEGIIMRVDENGNQPTLVIPKLKDIPISDRQAFIFSGFKIIANYLAAGKKVQLNVSIKL